MAKYGTSSYYADLYAGRRTKSTPKVGVPKFGTSSWEARYGKVTKLYGKSYTAKTASGEDIRIKKYTPGYFAKRAGQQPSVYISPTKERYISRPPPKSVSYSATITPRGETSLTKTAGVSQPSWTRGRTPAERYKTIYTAGEEVRVSPGVYKRWMVEERKRTGRRLAGEVLTTAGRPGYIPNIIEPIYEREIGQRLKAYTYKKIPKKAIIEREPRVVPDVYYAKRPSGEIIEIPKRTKEGYLKTKIIEPKKGGMIEGVKGKALKYVREKPSGVLASVTEIGVTAGATYLASAPRTAVPKAFKNLYKVKAKPVKVEPSLIKRPLSADGLIKAEPFVKGRQEVTFFFKKPKRLFGLIKPKTTIKKGSVTMPLQEVGVIQKGKSYYVAEKGLWSQVRMRPGTYGKERIVQVSRTDIVSVGREIAPKKQLYFTGLKSQRLYDVSPKGYKLAKGKVRTRYLTGTALEVPGSKDIIGNIKLKGGVIKTQRVFKSSGRFAKKPSTGIYKQSEFMWKSPKEVPKRVIIESIKQKPTLLKEAQRANIKTFRLTKPFKTTKSVLTFPSGKGTKTEVVAKPISQLRAESATKAQAKLFIEEETLRLGKYARAYAPPPKVIPLISAPKVIPSKQLIKAETKVKLSERSFIKTKPKIKTPMEVIQIPATSTLKTPIIDIGQITDTRLQERTTIRPRTTITPGIPATPTPGYDFGFRPPPTKIPPLFPPMWWTPRMKGAKPRKSKKGRKPYRYTPSLSAVFLNIKGAKPKRLTGLEVRPIIKRKKKKKTKGRKR